MIVNIQQKLKKLNKVLVAYVFENGMTIGYKNSNEFVMNDVVSIRDNEDGTTTMIINRDRLEELKCSVSYK